MLSQFDLFCFLLYAFTLLTCQITVILDMRHETTHFNGYSSDLNTTKGLLVR